MWRYIFIAVNYNGSKFTIDYVDSINNISTGEASKIEIIIIDNNSDSADFKKLQVAFDGVENIRLYKSSENLGYFGGLNKGIEMINGSDKDMFIVGNNDLTFDENFINELSRIKYSEEVLVIAPNIITKEGRQQNPHVIDRVRSIDKFKTRVYFSNYYVAQVLRFINQVLKNIFKKPTVLKNNYKQMIIRRGIGACYVLTPNFFKKFDKLDDRVHVGRGGHPFTSG